MTQKIFNVPPMTKLASFRHIPSAALHVSEPSPYMFGNPENPPDWQAAKWTNSNWLKSRFHFSFADYSNHRNMQFGVLRVLNDDLVQAARGFGEHPHRDMEICTYIVQGELTHKDSLGSTESLGRGAVQYMSAGQGVRHSENNVSKTNDLRFLQMWLLPKRRGLRPRYGGYTVNAAERIRLGDEEGRFYHLVSDEENNACGPTPVKLVCDVNIYVGETSQPNRTLGIDIAPGRMAYVVIVEGNDVIVSYGIAADKTAGADHPSPLQRATTQMFDALEVFSGPDVPLRLQFESTAPMHVICVEMALDENGGRGDLPAVENAT